MFSRSPHRSHSRARKSLRRLRILVIIGFLFGMSPAFAQYMPLEWRNGIPKLACAFNGLVPSQPCTLDTGSNATILPSEITMSDLKNDSMSAKTVAEQNVTCASAPISTLTSGDISFNPDHVVGCRNGTNPGIIGASALEGQIWKFDLAKNQLVLETVLPQGFLNQAFPIRRDSLNYIYLPITLDGVQSLAIFDTGISTDGVVNPEFINAHPAHFRLTGVANIQDPFGAKSTAQIYQLDQLTIGRQSFTDIRLLAVEKLSLWNIGNKAPLIIGVGIIKRLVWHLDLKQNIGTTEPKP